MSPPSSLQLSELFKKLRQEGMTILIIEHDMKVVMPLSESVIVMDEGAKIAEGRPEEIQKNPRVIQAYLGEG